MLQVVVVAHDQEAELEVQTDAWNSYEELRELVVDAVPNMFRDTDELTLEYKNEQSRWVRVKMKVARIRCSNQMMALRRFCLCLALLTESVGCVFPPRRRQWTPSRRRAARESPCRGLKAAAVQYGGSGASLLPELR